MTHGKTAREYIESAERWRRELRTLHKILRATSLTEEMKWGMPCYSDQGQNVVALVGFKSYFGLWFFQGALLDDDLGVLINAQRGKTKAQRQWRMTSAEDINPAAIRRYARAAAALAKTGAAVKPARRPAARTPRELEAAFNDYPEAHSAYLALRPAQRREFAAYIHEAKRPETKRRRVEKIMPLILAGVGLNDRYR